MRTIFCVFIFWVGLISTVFCQPPAALPDGLYARIETPRGLIVARLFPQEAPLTVTNFVGLAEGKLGPKPGIPFYDGLTFHRVVPGFVVQGGDPVGTGEGSAGYFFPDEFNLQLSHGAAGVLSMANDGPDTNGSQFFITLAAESRLDLLHSVFGQVIEGLDVLPRIRAGDRMRIAIDRRGEAAQLFGSDRPAFELLLALHRKKGRVAEEPALFEDSSGLLPDDPPRAKNYRRQLENLSAISRRRFFMRIRQNADENISDLAQSLALPLKLGPKDLLAVYVASQDQWAVCFGGESGAIGWDDDKHRAAALVARARLRSSQITEGKEKNLLSQKPLATAINGMIGELIDLARRDAGAIKKESDERHK